MLTRKRLEEIGYGSVRQSEEEGRRMARTLLQSIGVEEEEQQAFERWVRKTFGSAVDTAQAQNGGYMAWDAQIAWEAWKCRAKQKPVVLLNSSTVMSRGYVVRQIEAAGSTVQTDHSGDRTDKVGK